MCPEFAIHPDYQITRPHELSPGMFFSRKNLWILGCKISDTDKGFALAAIVEAI